jgi:hypothetical protein
MADNSWGFYCEIETGVVFDTPYLFGQEPAIRPEEYDYEEFELQQQQQKYQIPNKYDVCAIVAMTLFIFLI